MLYREIIAVCSEIHTIYINTPSNVKTGCWKGWLIQEEINCGVEGKFSSHIQARMWTQYVSPKSQYITTRKNGVTFKQTREWHRGGSDCSSLLFAWGRGFRETILSEQTKDWFCTAARSVAEVAVWFGCLFVSRSLYSLLAMLAISRPANLCKWQAKCTRDFRLPRR